MEVAVIDWKSIDSRFVRDVLYENINAPQWVDFSVPDVSIDDESWFCRPDCNHPKTLEDFYKETTPNSKSSSSVLEGLPFGERSRRDATLKKRGLTHASISTNKDLKCGRIGEDSENQNPNFSTPPNYKARVLKEAIKSSVDKKQISESTSRKEQPRTLRSTLSARNLFAGGELLSKVTEFCNELKKLAMRAKDRENVEEYVVQESLSDDNLGDKEKERKPFLEVSTEKSKAQQKSNFQEKARRKKRYDDAENTPITVDVQNIKHKEENMLPIRTCPPTPQCFSANRGPPRTNQLKAFKPRTPERGILQELGQRNMDSKMDEAREKRKHGGQASVVDGKEANAMDVFWFLKPCTLPNQAV